MNDSGFGIAPNMDAPKEAATISFDTAYLGSHFSQKFTTL